MTYHDTRAEYDAIAKCLEENDTEVDWEALMKSDWWVGPADWVPPPKWSLPKPFPSPIPPQTVSNLILSQVNKGFRIPWPLATSENAAPGGEGVEPAAAGGAATGHVPWKKFLEEVAKQQHTHVTIRLISVEERKALVRMAWIEEELRKREVERNRERVVRQLRGETRKVITRRSVKRLVRSAMLGNREAIGELERRGIVSGEELARWKGLAERKGARMRRLNKEANPKKKKSLFWPEGDGVKKKKEEEVEEKVSGDAEVVGPAPTGTPGEVELEVVRVGPNPRLLICRYFDAAGEVRVGVRVKSIRHFRRGMKFRMVPNGSDGNRWEYEGKMPRHVGRW